MLVIKCPLINQLNKRLDMPTHFGRFYTDVPFIYYV